MGKQQDRIDEEKNASGKTASNSAAHRERPPSTAAEEHKPKPATPEAVQTDELADDRFQGTDN